MPLGRPGQPLTSSLGVDGHFLRSRPQLSRLPVCRLRVAAWSRRILALPLSVPMGARTPPAGRLRWGRQAPAAPKDPEPAAAACEGAPGGSGRRREEPAACVRWLEWERAAIAAAGGGGLGSGLRRAMTKGKKCFVTAAGHMAQGQWSGAGNW